MAASGHAVYCYGPVMTMPAARWYCCASQLSAVAISPWCPSKTSSTLLNMLALADRPNLLATIVDRPKQNHQNARQFVSLVLTPKFLAVNGKPQPQLSSRRKFVTLLKKFLPISGAIALGCFALTGSPALAQNAKTRIAYPAAHGTSQLLRELPIDILGLRDLEAPEPKRIPLGTRAAQNPRQYAAMVQSEIRPNVAATQGVNFDGIGALGFAPSDVNMAAGPNHLVQTVNVRIAVYNKSGALLSGPTNLTTFFAPLGGNCAAGASDPIVNYDRLADRWVISDVGIGSTFSECVAVSKTNDPTGAYTLYAYSFGRT